jgi:hypothetical protein
MFWTNGIDNTINTGSKAHDRHPVASGSIVHNSRHATPAQTTLKISQTVNAQ